jgi:hypothetical protein
MAHPAAQPAYIALMNQNNGRECGGLEAGTGAHVDGTSL